MRETDALSADIPSSPTKSGGPRRLMLFVGGPLLLAGLGAGLWFQGSASQLLGLTSRSGIRSQAPILIELPEMVANLNSDPRHSRYVKLRVRLETPQANSATVNAALPKLIDVFQTYLREVRPDELQGALGTYRLRQELAARATIAVSPAKVTDVLFEEILVQ